MDPSLDPRRRFTTRQHNLLYASADGVCGACGAELEEGWHADHKIAHSRGGVTELDNGQALCPACNLKKGATSVAYHDKFTPRPFQSEVVKSVLDGFSSGRDTTVVLASPGSGKTLTYQAVATYLHREGLIDYAAIFVPRIVLAKQCETSWMFRLDQPDEAGNEFGGDHQLFDPSRRLGMIRHVPNRSPLTPPGTKGVGIVATYSALVKSPDVYIDHWAARHRGRFLLVADEAQFCGTAREDDATGGTAAGRWMKELHQYAAHTLLLTGTPYRSDDKPLILADYEPENEDGVRKLVHHAEAGYATGIAEGYLRRFEAVMYDARVRFKYVDNTAVEYDLSVNGEDLRDVVRKPDVWQPIADGVVEAVREKQKVHPGYRGLISCMEQNEARRVADYLQHKYPGLRLMISVSDDGEDAERALRDFRTRGADVLVTVRKAFIGYDCPEITVVGILTHYRDWGHLMQLVGRGLRTWKGVDGRTQSCRVICPDDPAMKGFIEFMRGESEQGLRERDRRDQSEERGDGGKNPIEQLGWVETAYATDARALSNDAELDADELTLIRAVKHSIGAVDDATTLKRFAEAMGLLTKAPVVQAPTPTPSTSGQMSIPLTEKEQIEETNRRTADLIKTHLYRLDIKPKDPEYRKRISRATAAVNTSAGVRAGDAWTLEQAQARLQAAAALLGSQVSGA
ncbi:HNH endonuclease [Micromonospora haikouensis]|uniref:HNH endonuclease n=1 Tax=Micromonospora haikouensis TaxID=686309 RepID=UPI00378F0720